MPEITQPRGTQPQNEPVPQSVSRARAIFDASENLKPFDPTDFDFAMTDENPEEVRAALQGSSDAASAQQVKPKTQRMLDMTPLQFSIVAALALALLCILATFGYLVFINP